MSGKEKLAWFLGVETFSSGQFAGNAIETLNYLYEDIFSTLNFTSTRQDWWILMLGTASQGYLIKRNHERHTTYPEINSKYKMTKKRPLGLEISPRKPSNRKTNFIYYNRIYRKQVKHWVDTYDTAPSHPSRMNN